MDFGDFIPLQTSWIFLNTGLIAYMKFLPALLAAIPIKPGYFCMSHRHPNSAKGLHTFQIFMFKVVKLKLFLLLMFDCASKTWHLHISFAILREARKCKAEKWFSHPSFFQKHTPGCCRNETSKETWEGICWQRAC